MEPAFRGKRLPMDFPSRHSTQPADSFDRLTLEMYLSPSAAFY